MRVNHPVTHREYAFPAGQSLVSVTDPQGRITYCNAAFIAVSGFSSEELMGQPHNIVRHPDMPAEAFRDMWSTIQAGLPWTGLVKNRRKDGDHYWVQANATAMRDGERIVGFLSVRTEPTREAVRQAEALYARMREEAAAGSGTLRLRHGEVVGDGWAARLTARLPRVSPGLLGVQALAVGAGSAAAWLAQPHPGPTGLVAALGSAAAAALLGAWATQRVAMRPLKAVLDDVHRMAAGDLTKQLQRDAGGLVGELQAGLRQLSVNLRAVIHDTRQEVVQVVTAAGEIRTGSADLSSRTEAQASNLQQTAASMEQMAATVDTSTQSATEGAAVAVQTADLSARSHQAVTTLADSMDGIARSSRRVAEIVQVIEDVSFRTNILALNAAVEAARAGEEGRGFAVVAAEVRALAQRVGAAAKEIKQLVGESTESVQEGRQRSQEAMARMAEALAGAQRVNTILSEVSGTAKEQSSGIAQINGAVMQLDGITQQNAAMVEQMSAAAASLTQQMDHVSNSMRLFRLRAGESTVAEARAVDMRKAAKAALEEKPAPAEKAKATSPQRPATLQQAPSARRPPAAGAAAAAAPAARRPTPAPVAAPASSDDEQDWQTF